MAFEFLDIHPDINVQESEYKRLLGYPKEYVVNDRVRELMDTTLKWYNENGKPWIYVRQVDAFEINNDHFLIDGKEFTSKRVFAQMNEAQADSAVVAAVSAGKNCEERASQLWQEKKPDEYFFMEVYGSAIVEHLIANAAGFICAWADQNSMAALPRYSPGYPEWDIREQQKLYDVIVQDKKYTFPEEIHVMNTGMLNPKKSLLTIFGITKQLDKVQRTANLLPCENCSLANCQYRRRPYKRSPQQIEDVGKLQSKMEKEIGSPLELNAKYSFSTKALEKWSMERLRLQFNDDRSIDAAFRYEGTTCSNMGRALEFDYHIRIESAETNYKIIKAACMPASGDSGHRFMCRYIENPTSMMSDLADEKPLLGKPLNDILEWKREYNPSACYCRPVSREHKWGLVFEVLHYALVQRGNQKVILSSPNES
jgi:hypothetical protein